mgnify:CR=1 FL=1
MSSLVKDRVLKRILMVGTGGTIACKSSEDGLKPLLTSEELLRYVPDTKEFCKVDSLQVINIDSTNMQPRYWLMIAETIEKYYEDYAQQIIEDSYEGSLKNFICAFTENHKLTSNEKEELLTYVRSL